MFGRWGDQGDLSRGLKVQDFSLRLDVRLHDSDDSDDSQTGSGDGGNYKAVLLRLWGRGGRRHGRKKGHFGVLDFKICLEFESFVKILLG